MTKPTTTNADESAIRTLIQHWAKAVREKNFPAILTAHSADLIMFDVPPPFESIGLQAYRETWDLFYASQPEPIAFDIQRLDIVAGTDVAFATAHMQCAELDQHGRRTPLNFRLTLGLRKIAGQWTILHEHHSVPAI